MNLPAWIPCLVATLATAAPGAGATLDTALYDRLLTAHTRAVDEVVGTQVDYGGLENDPQWAAVLESLAAVDPATLANRDERLAFWINAYNILAIDMVRRHYPVVSIRDIGSLLRPVWKRPAGSIGGRTVTLDEIEHEILRPMGQPRIHAAIVCASTSCPSLRREAFVAPRLDAQLDDALRRFLGDPAKGSRVTPEGVRLSKIFDWFSEDFETGGGVIAFLRPHLPDAVAAQVDRLAGDLVIDHFDYDWSLNDWRRAAPRP